MKRTPLKRSDKPMKRTELKRGTKGLKRTAMKRGKSEAQADYDAEFEAMKPVIMARANGHCEAMQFAIEFTGGGLETLEVFREFYLFHTEGLRDVYHNAVHVHHRKYRSRGGSNSESNLIAVCSKAHDWIHAHGGFGEPANLLGLALSAGELEIV